jgi:hypothetical protein
MICTRCIIPDTYPGITFENNLCEFCRIAEKNPRKKKVCLGEEKLREILTSKPAGKYHCLLSLSGGKDSSYSIYYIAKKLGLNPLACHYDTGLINETTKANIEKICTRLSVDIVIGGAFEYRKKMLQESLAIARLGKFGGITGLGGSCTSCEASIRSFAINTAKKHKIPYIVWSATDFEDSPEKLLNPGQKPWRETHGESSRGLGFQRMKNIYDSLVGDYRILKYFWHIPFMKHCMRHLTYRIKNSIALDVPGKLAKYDPFFEVSFKGTGVEALYFYDYIPYDPFKAIETLNEELEWQTIAGKGVRQDCMMHHLLNYRAFKSTGITADGFFHAVMVREGLLARDEALEKERISTEALVMRCRETLKDLGTDIDLDLLV